MHLNHKSKVTLLQKLQKEMTKARLILLASGVEAEMKAASFYAEKGLTVGAIGNDVVKLICAFVTTGFVWSMYAIKGN